MNPCALGEPLTVTEDAVLHLLVVGLNCKQIAAARRMSPSSAHRHVGAITVKMGASSRTQLPALYFGLGKEGIKAVTTKWSLL